MFYSGFVHYYSYFHLVLISKVRLILIYQILCNPQQYGHYAQAETNADKRLLLQQKLGLVKKTVWYIKQPSNQNDALVTLALNHSGNKTPTISKKFQCYLQTHPIWGYAHFWCQEFVVFDSIEITFVLPTNADSTIRFIEMGFQWNYFEFNVGWLIAKGFNLFWLTFVFQKVYSNVKLLNTSFLYT